VGPERPRALCKAGRRGHLIRAGGTFEDKDLNVFHALKGKDFSRGRLTFQPDASNVQRSIGVPIVRSATVQTFPTSYSKRAHTLWTLAADRATTRARLGSQSDYFHLPVEYPPKLSVSKRVNAFKGTSSRMLRKARRRDGGAGL